MNLFNIEPPQNTRITIHIKEEHTRKTFPNTTFTGVFQRGVFIADDRRHIRYGIQHLLEYNVQWSLIKYITAEEKAEKIYKIINNINIDEYTSQMNGIPRSYIIDCITKGLQEFALGKNTPLIVLYNITVNNSIRIIKELDKNIMLPPELISFEQDEAGEMGVKYYIETINANEAIFIQRADETDTGRVIDYIYLPDKTIIQLADYIRNHTKK